MNSAGSSASGRGWLAILVIAWCGLGLSYAGHLAGQAARGSGTDQLTSWVAPSLAVPVQQRLGIQSWRTASGTRVLFVAAHGLPMFDLRLTFAAGSSRDGDTPGLAELAIALFDEGVPGKDADAIARGFADLGAEFGNEVHRDMAILSLRCLTDRDKREPALRLLQQVIGRPTFPEASLRRVRSEMLDGLRQQQRDPSQRVINEVFQRLYGPHPYGHPVSGTVRGLAQIDRKKLLAFHQQAYSSGNAVLALVGDLSRQQAEAIAAEVSAALPQGPALAGLPLPGRPQSGVFHRASLSAQTHLMLAQLGVSFGDPDRVALMLGNQILGGGGFGSRLMEAVREKRGLAYGIESNLVFMASSGPFYIDLQTRAELSEATRQLVQDVWHRYLAQGPTQSELDDAKRELFGALYRSTASNSDTVALLGVIGFYNLPLSYREDEMNEIQALSSEQVREAMRRHFSPDGFVVVQVGPRVEQKPLPPLEGRRLD